MRIVGSMVIMLVAGLALGSGASTLMRSTNLDRCFHREMEWEALVKKQNTTITGQTNIIREQTAALEKLTASSGRLLQALRNRL